MWVVKTVLMVVLSMTLFACKKELVEEMNSYEFKAKLSEYNIFQGEMNQLTPQSDFHFYELSSTLFTDFAEKQRLIYLPSGTKTKVVDNELIEFPEGTIIVKTFFYFKDKRNPSLGTKIMETRLLIKSDGLWNVATYMWNEAQTEANLLTIGYSKNVNWIDDEGNSRAVAYKIPKNDACVTCHYFNGQVSPIGPKAKNLNREVFRNGSTQNQLAYLHSVGIMDSVNPTDYLALPDHSNTSLDRLIRARAYMEVNCAHCHRPEGFASHKEVNFLYEVEDHDMGLGPHADHLGPLLEKGKMPKLGTTLVDTVGVNLMKDFLKTIEH